MAQLNVAREPSMDEILASIRKIIESNEPGPAGSSLRQTFEDAAEDEIELTIDTEIEAATFGPSGEPLSGASSPSAASGGAMTGSSPTDNPASPSPLSLADVAARVRAASERHAVNHFSRDQPEAGRADSSLDSPAVTSRIAAASASANPASAAPAESPMSGAPLRNAAPTPITAEPPSASHAAPAEEPAELDDLVGAIVSPAVGRQVARAFDDLAHAVENGPKRSFDEIAEAMLRPMLQEWLDDNLPTLVERLVREEIERVARGPRR